MGYGAIQIQEGITLLSELGIDISKNWQGYQIKNVADPSDAQDVVTQAALEALLAQYVVNVVDGTNIIDLETVYQIDDGYFHLISMVVRNTDGDVEHSVTALIGNNPPTAIAFKASIDRGGWSTVMFVVGQDAYFKITVSDPSVVKVEGTVFNRVPYWEMP